MIMGDRGSEIRRLLELSKEEVVERAGERLVVCNNLESLHRHFAESIASEIRIGNNMKGSLRLILPVGPAGQYPILADTINRENLSLANCCFFFMDEYCDSNGQAVAADHPLSFKGEIEKIFFSKLNPGCGLVKKNVVFPDHLNLHALSRMIEDGGIDTCYAGLGIHGHLAFNEPESRVEYSEPRLVYLNRYTITINAIRAETGGDLENFPKKAVTLGMRQLLGADRIRIYCRNDIPGVDWANTVLRIALFGEPGDDYPVTYIRDKNFKIITTSDTLASPRILL